MSLKKKQQTQVNATLKTIYAEMKTLTDEYFALGKESALKNVAPQKTQLEGKMTTITGKIGELVGNIVNQRARAGKSVLLTYDKLGKIHPAAAQFLKSSPLGEIMVGEEKKTVISMIRSLTSGYMSRDLLQRLLYRHFKMDKTTHPSEEGNKSRKVPAAMQKILAPVLKTMQANIAASETKPVDYNSVPVIKIVPALVTAMLDMAVDYPKLTDEQMEEYKKKVEELAGQRDDHYSVYQEATSIFNDQPDVLEAATIWANAQHDQLLTKLIHDDDVIKNKQVSKEKREIKKQAEEAAGTAKKPRAPRKKKGAEEAVDEAATEAPAEEAGEGEETEAEVVEGGEGDEGVEEGGEDAAEANE